jgi:hypothetical protein
VWDVELAAAIDEENANSVWRKMNLQRLLERLADLQLDELS